MPTPNERTVTAQDFINSVTPYTGDFDQESVVLEKFNALLSRARQEARREALKEMDEAHQDPASRILKYRSDELLKLRQEYQTN